MNNDSHHTLGHPSWLPETPDERHTEPWDWQKHDTSSALWSEGNMFHMWVSLSCQKHRRLFLIHFLLHQGSVSAFRFGASGVGKREKTMPIAPTEIDYGLSSPLITFAI